MKNIKRIKVSESTKRWNDKNPNKRKKGIESISRDIGIRFYNISLWNTGKVSKQVQELFHVSQVLKYKFDDLFVIKYNPTTDEVTLERIAIQEAMDQWNSNPENRKRSLKSVGKLTNYGPQYLKAWNEGKIPFAIHNFFNFCKNVGVRPSKAIEY